MNSYDKDVFKRIQSHFKAEGLIIKDLHTFQAMLIGKELVLTKMGGQTQLMQGDKVACSWTELKNNTYTFNNELCQLKLSNLEKLTTLFYNLRDSLRNMLSRLRKRFAKE